MNAFQYLWTGWALSWAAWNFLAQTDDPETGGEEGKGNALVIMGLVLITGLLPIKQIWSTSEHARKIALGIAVLGLALAVGTRFYMGEKFDVRADAGNGARLSRGPFAVLKHPIYTGVGVAAIATAWARGDLGTLLGAGMLSAGAVLKAGVEDAQGK